MGKPLERRVAARRVAHALGCTCPECWATFRARWPDLDEDLVREAFDAGCEALGAPRPALASTGTVSILRSYGNGHYTKKAGGAWVYTLTGDPVPGAVDMRLGKKRVMWAPELHPEALLNVDAAAALVGIKPASWRREVGRGQAPAAVLHVGFTPVWTVGVIQAWLKKRRER
jgi:hypothetical protein